MKSTAQTKADNSVLDKLNAEQRQAVTHGEGPLLIVAGAGTGKTTVITHRIAWLIEQGKAEPEEILALTFTEKAAAEMEGRIMEALPLGRVPQHISTFHAFGDTLLREFSLDIGLPPTFAVLRDLEQVLLLREHLYELPLDFFRPRAAPGRHLKMLAKFFSRIKQDDISVEEYAERVSAEEKRVAAMEESPELADAAYDLKKSQEIAACFKAYEDLKEKRYAIDQTDQVYKAYRLLRDNRIIRRRVRERFKYILVDEFQDVDVVQAKLVDLLAGPDGNLTVVGDDDQSIYGFRGASVSNILRFPETHRKTTDVVLTKNYRSSQPILDASYRLIQSNGPFRLERTQDINKRLDADKPDGPAPLAFRFASIHDESEAVARRIKELLKSPDQQAGEIAILTRTRDLGEYFRAALSRHEVPAAAEGTAKLYEQVEIRLCLAFLDLVVNPRQHGRLRLLATSELYGMPHGDMAQLEQVRRGGSEDLWDLLGSVTQQEYSQPAAKAAERLREHVSKFCELADSLNVGQLLYRWLSEHTDWVRRESVTEEDALRTQNLSKFFRRIRTFVENAEDRSVGAWKEYFQDILAYGEDPAASEIDIEREAVRILTAHSAKGLEFDTVFIGGLSAELFPLRNQGEQLPTNLLESANLPENDHLREERRLCYVAMTRARKRLILTSAENYDNVKNFKPSPFLSEALGKEAGLPALGGGKPADPLTAIGRSESDVPLALIYTPPDPLELSYTQISAYAECPLKFYWEHVEHVYVETNPATEYGNLLHELIAMLNQLHMRSEELTNRVLKERFEDAWASRRWVYETPEHRADAKARAWKGVLRYWEEERQRKPAYAVEEEFRLTVGGVIVKGRFDRIDKADGKYSLVDYKSSEVANQKQAERKLTGNQQLTLYAMALKDRFGEYPEKMSLHFLDSGIVATTKASPLKIRNMTEKVARVADGIRRRDFTPKRSRHYCTPTIFNFCPGNILKPAREA